MEKRPLIIDSFGAGRFQHKLLSEAKYDERGKFVQGMVVEGILQRANAINQNGRKYPKSILLREADNYLKEYIKQKRSFGELDHPDCVTPDTQILTKDGWKLIKDISENEIVLTLNPNTNKPEYQQITRKIDQEYAGKMIEFVHTSFSACVTPNHKFWVTHTYDTSKYEMVEARNLNSGHMIPKLNSGWEGNDISQFKIQEDLNLDPLYIDTEIFVDLLGWYLAEGWGGESRIFIEQQKKEGIEELQKLMEKLPFNTTCYYTKGGNPVFNFSNPQLNKYLVKLGKAYTKYIPQEVKDLSSKYLNILYVSLMKGDGCGTDYYTSSKQLASDVSEILVKMGFGSSISIGGGHPTYYKIKNIETQEEEIVHNLYYYTKDKYKNKENFEIIDKFKEENDFILYTVRKKTSEYYRIAEMYKNIIQYDDRIYCVEVPNHIIYLMRNGKQFWSGNSSIVSMQTASHWVTDLWWEGNDLYGRIELLDTPCGRIVETVLKRGLTIGISSRGLGSVKALKEDADTVEVQDDFEIVSWDFVSNPSTQGAFLKPVKESLTEGYTKNKSGIYVPEYKYNRVNQLITDILLEF